MTWAHAVSMTTAARTIWSVARECIAPAADGAPRDVAVAAFGSDVAADDCAPGGGESIAGGDATVPDDDATVGDDDATVGDDDATVGDDDATVGDDDATVAGDDAVACGDDAAKPEGVANSDDAARGDACDRRMCERADRPVITEATTHNRATTPHHMKSGAEGRR